MDPAENSTVQLIGLNWDNASWNIGLTINSWLGLAVLLVCAVMLFRWPSRLLLSKFEIDQAEIGVGSSKFSFRPNLTDRQVAYAIWVELSTRKVGLPIDLDHDVISEIYDSWYAFFSVTRELVKDIPVSKVKQKSTQAIIRLSIEVLNEGLRPHLTRWQARFRHWYEREIRLSDQRDTPDVADPQKMQSQFPQYEELKIDLLRVNESLVRYRKKMFELVMSA